MYSTKINIKIVPNKIYAYLQVNTKLYFIDHHLVDVRPLFIYGFASLFLKSHKNITLEHLNQQQIK